MGGFAGHMMHLNDNPNLTFGKIRDILNKAAKGELIGTEKTDGQNLFVSYSVRNKEARAVRNKGEIKKGGLDPAGLAKKFADRGDLEKTFNESFKAFEDAARNLPLEQRLKIFGPDANIFYNAEIMNPSSPNVINYDTKSLLIHRVGHVQRDKHNGKIEPLNDPERVRELEEALRAEQDDVAVEQYGVKVNAMKHLAALTNDKPLDNALARLDNFMDENNLTDKSTIGDYIVETLKAEIDEMLPDASTEIQNMLLNRMLGNKGATVTQILARIPQEAESVREVVRELVESNKSLIKSSLYPLEDLIHDFAVEMLRGLESAFILDNKKEVKRLKDEVALAKKVIEDSGNEDAMKILNRQMEKLKDVENVSTATEGFVFDYDGNTYKFTGGFAPINQILGLFKYGRGNVPPLKKLQEEELDDDTAVEKEKIFIYPGRFQPMGQHHAETYRKIAEKYGTDNTYVATSNKVNPPKSPFNFQEKKEIMIRHGIPEDKIILVKNPYNVLELLNAYDPGEVEVSYFVGAKDMAEDPRFQKRGGVSKEGYDWKIAVAPHVDLEIEGFGEMSGTSLRQALERADEETFEEIMGWFDPAIHQMILDKLNTIEEISGAGAAGGYSMPLGQRKGKQKRLAKYEEKGMIQREEVVVEMRLRELIRNRIQKQIKESKEEGIIYINESQRELLEQYQMENALRHCIRKIILQEKTEPVPHANTGINQLSELLKKIVPILSVGFKSLTTSTQQRTSYRSHILNAVINALAPIQAEDDALPDDLGEELDIEIEDDDDKFIDIDPPAEAEEEEEAFQTLPGQDLTGRNVAMKDFDRIERIILDSYEVLDDEKDQDLFYDYLLTNLKLYFDKFEEELEGSPDEPTTPEYEEEIEVEDELPAETPEELEDASIVQEVESEKQRNWAKWQRGLKDGDPQKKLTNDEADEFIGAPLSK